MPIDYSKFESIVDSDDDKEIQDLLDKDTADASKPKHCANCHETPEKPVRCGTCKTTLYCNQNCQKSDWKFHKRICTKSDTAASTGKDKSPTKEKPPPKPSSASAPKTEVVRDDDDEKIDWYRHRETKLPSCPSSAPQKITDSGNGTARAPEQGSAWNAAGTWEDKDVTKWAEGEIEKRCTNETSCSYGLIRTRCVICQGDASKTVIRGQTRYLFDFNIRIKWEARITSSAGTEITFEGGLFCEEFSHQTDIANLDFRLEKTEVKPEVKDENTRAVAASMADSAKTDLVKKARENLASFLKDMEAL